MPRVVISDTSSLIALANIGELTLLQKLYNEIIITPEIGEEFGSELPPWVIVERVKDQKKIELLNLKLDIGESSGITLALEKEDCL